MLPLFFSLYLRTSGALHTRITDRQRGQSTLEYVGMIAVAALVVVAVATTIKGVDLGSMVTNAVEKVTSAVG